MIVRETAETRSDVEVFADLNLRGGVTLITREDRGARKIGPRDSAATMVSELFP